MTALPDSAEVPTELSGTPEMRYIDILRWLSRQTQPVWGGHLARGDPPGTLMPLLNLGLIALTSAQDGYRISRKGLSYVQALGGATRRCPTCGRAYGS
jgi:hypothetical protein